MIKENTWKTLRHGGESGLGHDGEKDLDGCHWVNTWSISTTRVDLSNVCLNGESRHKTHSHNLRPLGAGESSWHELCTRRWQAHGLANVYMWDMSHSFGSWVFRVRAVWEEPLCSRDAHNTRNMIVPTMPTYLTLPVRDSYLENWCKLLSYCSEYCIH